MTASAKTGRNIAVTRTFDAPVALVWKAWTDPQLVMRWWGPDYYTAPVCQMDFREGGTTLVAMRSPDGQDSYSTWKYRRIVPHELIEYVQSMSDAAAQPIDPTTIGLPADFPHETRTVVTFKPLGAQTEMTITEYDFTAEGQMYEYAVLGLNQCMDKMVAALKDL